MSDSQPWDKREGETRKAYACFCSYRDMGHRRESVETYRIHYSKPHAKQAPGYWNEWKAVHEWDARAEAWDAYQERRKQEAAIEKGTQDHLTKLELYRQSHEASGSLGYQSVLAGKKLLLKFLGENPRIKSVDDAYKLAMIVRAVEASSSESWAQAIGVENMLTMFGHRKDKAWTSE